VKYNNDQLKELLKLLKDNEIATAGIAENESLLPLLKYTDVGIAFGSPTSCPDLHRYSDISLQDTGHFLKLLLVHSRVPHLLTSEQLPRHQQTPAVPPLKIPNAILLLTPLQLLLALHRHHPHARPLPLPFRMPLAHRPALLLLPLLRRFLLQDDGQ
jgi:hypothetical protein